LFLEVLEDYHHADILFKSGRPIQLDIYLPEKKLAFEYQGEHHFQDIYSLGPRYVHAERDQEKRLACKQAGIGLIEVPYWWDFKKDSLIATVHKYRPDLVSSPGYGIPIADKPQKELRTGKFQ
jgi:hypothetical protein